MRNRKLRVMNAQGNWSDWGDERLIENGSFYRAVEINEDMTRSEYEEYVKNFPKEANI